MSNKLTTTDIKGDYWHYCPGCEQLHQINTERKNDNGAQWSFDGNMEQPTFAPSINITLETSPGKTKRCHYFIDNGRINYCGDSTHALSGQSVELPEIPTDLIERHLG